VTLVKQPKITLAIALVAFFTEEIWSLFALSDRGVSLSAESGAALLLSVSLAIGLVVLLALAVGIALNRHSKSNFKQALLALAIVAVHVYASHELLQLLSGGGRAVGIHGLFGHGGWLLVPLLLFSVTSLVALVLGIRSFRKECHFAVDVPIGIPWSARRAIVIPSKSWVSFGHFRPWGARGPPLAHM
jgi:hypothetical protein